LHQLLLAAIIFLNLGLVAVEHIFNGLQNHVMRSDASLLSSGADTLMQIGGELYRGRRRAQKTPGALLRRAFW